VVSVNPGTLAPCVYRGDVSYQILAAAVRTVNVTMIVEASGAACTPRQLVPALTGLVTNFSIAISLPTPLSLKSSPGLRRSGRQCTSNSDVLERKSALR